MRIASFTMVGQCPQLIDFHVRNLKWALSNQDHIFIVTLKQYIDRYNLVNDDRVTYIPIIWVEGWYAHFWDNFPRILNRLNIRPEYFLFTEQDIFFTKPVDILGDSISFLNHKYKYHGLYRGKLEGYRIWESAHLFEGSIIRQAIRHGINFGKPITFFTEELGYSTPPLYKFKITENFDEFSLFHYLVLSKWPQYTDYTVHIRGPERVYRDFPEMRTDTDINLHKHKAWYIDFASVAALYYLIGVWSNPIDYKVENSDYIGLFERLTTDWMNENEKNKLSVVLSRLDYTQAIEKPELDS